ncbi:MAG: hypothetical protein J2P16_00015 [Mycobacterium sp.]|nr:hypothetical protein [Mycobacterium sp.]
MLAFDPNDADRWREANERVDDAKFRRDQARDTAEGSPDDAEAGARYAAAQEKLDEAEAERSSLEASIETVTFHLKGIGPQAMEDLQAAHPASRDEREKHKRDMLANGEHNPPPLQFSPKTFIPALMAATCTAIDFPDGTVTPEDVDDWAAEIKELWDSDTFDTADMTILATNLRLLDQRGSYVGEAGKGFAKILPSPP